VLVSSDDVAKLVLVLNFKRMKKHTPKLVSIELPQIFLRQFFYREEGFAQKLFVLVLETAAKIE